MKAIIGLLVYLFGLVLIVGFWLTVVYFGVKGVMYVYDVGLKQTIERVWEGK